MIIKLLGTEASLSSGSSVSNGNLVRVFNTGATAVLSVTNSIASNTAAVVANVTMVNTIPVIIQKQPWDVLTGNNMVGVRVAFKS